MNSSSNLDRPIPVGFDLDTLSIALIGPDVRRRLEMVAALSACTRGEVSKFSDYPPSLDEIPFALVQNFDVVIVDLDSNQKCALELAETLCTRGTATVMVYSEKADGELLVRSMRAGVREFLTLPLSNNTMSEALMRAATRRTVSRSEKQTNGKLLVFIGAKGGAGVTMIASNFAVALAQASSETTLFIDLDFPLGDAALNLGITSDYSVVDALENSARLDTSFFSKLLTKHSSGLFVLAAPGQFPRMQVSDHDIDKLVAVARRDFDYVVVDVGSRFDGTGTALFKDAFAIYLVTQAGIPELRNSNRIISHFFSSPGPKLEIVMNRYMPRASGVTDEDIRKALTRPVQWKIPNDHAAVLRMQRTATPIALDESPVARQIKQMARSASGQTAVAPKKKGFSLFG
jgi:pilus assembly protein CpaE